jgi:hypothetical protein
VGGYSVLHNICASSWQSLENSKGLFVGSCSCSVLNSMLSWLNCFQNLIESFVCD